MWIQSLGRSELLQVIKQGWTKTALVSAHTGHKAIKEKNKNHPHIPPANTLFRALTEFCALI